LNAANLLRWTLLCIFLILGYTVNRADAVFPFVINSPSNLKAGAVSSSEIDIRWTAPSNLGAMTVTGYRIDRSYDGGSTWQPIVYNTGSPNTAYSDHGLAAGTTYTYRIYALTQAIMSPPSDPASATTYSTPPEAPTGLVARPVSSTEIDLSWTPPYDDGGSKITGYKVERSSNLGAAWFVILSGGQNNTISYRDLGLSPSTTYEYRVYAINAKGTSPPSSQAIGTTEQKIWQIQLENPGLIVGDRLNNETETQKQIEQNPGYWSYGGDAPAEGAQYDFFKDLLGLHLGVKAATDGMWAGYYAESQNTTGLLFHAIVTTPLNVTSTPKDPQWYENGLYVQRASMPVNYVSCFSVTGAWGTEWVVASALGNDSQVINETALWVDNSTSQPTTRDCTIITNGTNYLKVYLDGNMVYESNKLNLQMPEPFNSYLEPQSSYAGALLNGTYADYYATTGENVTVRGLPASAARVDLVDSNGNVLATAPALSGAATMDVGQFDFPIAAGIRAYDSSNDTVATTAGTQQVYGGDVYAAR